MVKKERDYAFLIRLTAEEKEGLDKYSEENDLSKAQTMRKGLNKLIKK